MQERARDPSQENELFALRYSVRQRRQVGRAATLAASAAQQLTCQAAAGDEAAVCCSGRCRQYS